MDTSQGIAMSGPRAEPDIKPGNGLNPAIKEEMDLMDIFPADDDIYEDAGDLDFSSAAHGLFLTRIPKYIWENWSQLDEDEEIRLGTVRVEGSSDKAHRMSLLLHQDVARKGKLPSEYVLQVTNTKPANTFVFNEKDLPGYSSKQRASGKAFGGAATSTAPRPIYQSPATQGVVKHRGGSTRKGIPKQTALAGRILQEINCVPVDNLDYRQIMETRAAEEEKKIKREILFEPGLVAATSGGTMAAGAGVAFDSFIRTKSKRNERSQKLKAARIPQNELLDLIYDCFKEFEYWPMKALIDRLQQPAAYLKDTLEMVAHLVRSGRFANNWQLKPEAKSGAYEAYEKVKDEKAPGDALEGVSDLDELDDQDDEDMVDVIPP